MESYKVVVVFGVLVKEILNEMMGIGGKLIS